VLGLMVMLVLLLTWAFSATACASRDDEIVKAHSNQGPAISIVSPQPGATLSGNAVQVQVEISDFIIDTEAVGKAKAPGRGHWHLYLDGEFIGAVTTEDTTLEQVTQGPHHLRVALANNDHSPLSPPAEASVVIDVGAGEFKPEGFTDDTYRSVDPYQDIDTTLPDMVASPHFVGSSPTHGDELYHTPGAIAIYFDFKLAPESAITLTREGQPMPIGPTVVAPDQYSMSASIASELPPGIYEVAYQACWPYLNCHSGSFAFVVEDASTEESGYY
jgi:methionine-rich copper-binding protein CopC